VRPRMLTTKFKTSFLKQALKQAF